MSVIRNRACAKADCTDAPPAIAAALTQRQANARVFRVVGRCDMCQLRCLILRSVLDRAIDQGPQNALLLNEPLFYLQRPVEIPRCRERGFGIAPMEKVDEYQQQHTAR